MTNCNNNQYNLSLIDLLATLWRFKYFILSAVVLCLLATGFLLFFKGDDGDKLPLNHHYSASFSLFFPPIVEKGMNTNMTVVAEKIAKSSFLYNELSSKYNIFDGYKTKMKLTELKKRKLYEDLLVVNANYNNGSLDVTFFNRDQDKAIEIAEFILTSITSRFSALNFSSHIQIINHPEISRGKIIVPLKNKNRIIILLIVFIFGLVSSTTLVLLYNFYLTIKSSPELLSKFK